MGKNGIGYWMEVEKNQEPQDSFKIIEEYSSMRVLEKLIEKDPKHLKKEINNKY